MEVIVVVILIGLAVFLFTNRKSFFYFFAAVDIFLRILYFIAANVGIPEIQSLIYKYFPSSIAGMISMYSSGVIETILLWAYLVCYIIFEVYLVKLLFHKR